MNKLHTKETMKYNEKQYISSDLAMKHIQSSMDFLCFWMAGSKPNKACKKEQKE